jgi:hypothetical protein
LVFTIPGTQKKLDPQRAMRSMDVAKQRRSDLFLQDHFLKEFASLTDASHPVLLGVRFHVLQQSF